MNEFHHHPDGIIFVRTPSVTYAGTLANYGLDAVTSGLAALPALPSGQIERRYRPGTGHVLSDGANQSGDVVPWVYGDAAIAAVNTLIAAKATRETVV